MDKNRNPFFELYAGEKISASDFVTVFSPFLVDYAEELFSAGNVALLGTQGCGKSMLLSLLKSELRREYAKHKIPFPVPARARKFIGAGVNLSTCGAIDFGERPILAKENKEDMSSAFFADYINYWITVDIIRSIQTLSELECHEGYGIGIDLSPQKIEHFCKSIKVEDCWLGYFSTEFNTLDGFVERARQRISAYRRFLSFNTDFIDESIVSSKTHIGEPISAVASALWASGIVPTDVRFFVNIDQYEELANLDTRGEGTRYRRTINRALLFRTSNVDYRIGARKYSWSSGTDLDDSGSKIEEDRNYKVVDIDTMLRRKENSPWIFPGFARDVFTRRIKFSGVSYDTRAKDPLRLFLGRGLTPQEEGLHYARKSPERAIRLDGAWPAGWCDFLMDLAKHDPLSARLGEGWARQRGKSKVVHDLPSPPYPWEKQYWRKERVDQALMQIAGRCGQRMIWSGADDVVELSGSNILVFLSLCQRMWSISSSSKDQRSSDVLSEVDPIQQSVAIYDASEHWFRKILNETGMSLQRHRFVSRVGSLFYKMLYDDSALSYPGRNGFSLSDAELAAAPEVRTFLSQLSDYGNLLESPHRTKEKDGQPRTKWYLHPILCPRFRIPHIRTKEPLYAHVADVRAWMKDTDAPPNKDEDGQLSLFDGQRS